MIQGLLPGHCPLSGVDIMSTMLWKLALSLFSGKRQGGRGSAYSEKPIKQS